MEGIQTQAMPYAAGVYKTNPGVSTPQIQPSAPNTDNKEGHKKLETALKGLAIAAAAGVAIYGGAKAAQYLKAGHTPKELASAIGTKARTLTEQAGAKLKNLGHKTNTVHTGEKLPLFDPKNAKPGRYADSAGNLVVIDKYGTSIVDFGQNRFLVNHGVTQKMYDGVNNLAAGEKVTGAVKDAVQKADLALIAPKALPASTSSAVKTEALTIPSGNRGKAMALSAGAAQTTQKAIPLPESTIYARKAIPLPESTLFGAKPGLPAGNTNTVKALSPGNANIKDIKALPAGNKPVLQTPDVIALPANIEEFRALPINGLVAA